VRPSSLLAVAVSAVLGVALGIGGGLALDHASDPVQDPLHLEHDMVNQACGGGYVLVIGKGNGASSIAPDLAANPKGRYLDTDKSCPTVWRDSSKSTPRWVAYLGPYESGAEACTKRMTPEHKGTTVARLQRGATDTIHCLCYLDYKTMPTLETGMEAGITDGMWTRALQNMLVDLGRAKKSDTTGVYDLTTAAQIRQIQREHNLSATGVVDADTWNAVQDGCQIYDVASTNASP
jgi:peptidoglycan hydrolase-like protein with peptidoglycan-binding domain